MEFVQQPHGGFTASGGVIDGAQQFLAAHLALDNFSQKCAALSFADELIDVGDEALRQEDMGAFLYHGPVPSIMGLRTLDRNPAAVKYKALAHAVDYDPYSA